MLRRFLASRTVTAVIALILAYVACTLDDGVTPFILKRVLHVDQAIRGVTIRGVRSGNATFRNFGFEE